MPGDEAADMGDPGDRHVGQAERPGEGAEMKFVPNQMTRKMRGARIGDHRRSEPAGIVSISARPYACGPSGAPGWNMNRVAAPISPESAPEAPISGMKSIGVSAQWASAAAIAVTPMKTRNRAAPNRRATGGPKARARSC